MLSIYFSRFFSLFISISLLVNSLPLVAIAEKTTVTSQNYETAITRQEPLFVYLGEELSNLARIVDQASMLDEDQNSIMHAMKNYMDEGFLVAGYDEVIEALQYAQSITELNTDRSGRDTTKNQLNIEISELIEQIMNGALCIDQESIERGCAPKGCCPAASTDYKDKDCKGIVNCCRVFLINKELQVCGNALFKGKVKIQEDLHVSGDLKVGEDAVFKEDVQIKGSLTAADAFISSLDTTALSVTNATIDNLSVNDFAVSGCIENLCVENLSVTDLVVTSCMDSLCVLSLSAVDAVIDNLIVTSTILDSIIGNLTVTGTATITDLVVLSCIDTLCVNDLSVTDISISGTLSVNDIIVDDATILSLSVTDAIIQNATITDLVVLSCMDSLCVNDLSGVDISISGTLSVNDIIIDDATILSLSVTDAIIQNATITDLVVLSCMDSLCVNTLSVVDISISGTLSVNDIIIDDATILSLSVTDAIIQNATITDLVVLSCMDSLCVNDLSVVDISISGTLSVNDIIIDDATVSSFSATDVVINNSLTIPTFTPAGVVHNNASGLLSSSLIVNADVDPAAAIVDTKLATISTAGKVANSATTATSTNTPNTIVLRDGAGNFSAGTITAALNGNATTATTAVNFSGALAGEVTGTQGATVVTNAVSANTANAIVRRTATGGFSAGAISLTDGVVSSSLILTSFGTAGVVHNNASGLLSSSLIVNADVAAGAGIVDTKLATISTAGKVSNSATTATSANTPNTIVLRDGAGNFSAGTITAALNGNATTATTAVNFSGSLAGNVTGTQGATVVSVVGGQTAANVAAATVLANAATSANTANAIVRRDGSGNFSAGTITASLNGNATTATTAVNFSGALAGEVTGPQGATVVTNAVSANTANAIVRRTATGGFSAGVVSLTDAVATGNLVFTGGTSTSTTGNIIKGANTFIHNFNGNTFLGINAGNFTLTAGGNVGIGVSALSSLTSGAQNISMGSGSLSNTTTGTANTALGFRAMETNITGSANTGLGQNTLLVNTAGSNNVAVGAHTLESNTTGNLNVAIGFNALNSNTTGVQNTALGNNALENLTTGVQNTALGKFAGQNCSGASSNNIYINNLGTVESNTIRIGNNTEQTSCFISGIRGATTAINDAVAVLIDSNGQLGTTSSTRRVKHDIEDMADQSSDILNLRPVTFVYNSDQSNTKQYGLIAEEVDEVFPAIVVHDKDGQPETVQYHVLPVLLLNEMKKQQVLNARQDEAIAHLNITVEAMQMAINELQLKLMKHIN